MTTTPTPDPDPPDTAEPDPLLDAGPSIPDARPAYFPNTDEWWPDDS